MLRWSSLLKGFFCPWNTFRPKVPMNRVSFTQPWQPMNGKKRQHINDVNTCGDYRYSALEAVTSGESEEILRMCLDKGAASSENPNKIQTLFEKGANANFPASHFL